MSERGTEPDIEPRRVDVAEVPKADIQVAQFTFSMSLAVGETDAMKLKWFALRAARRGLQAAKIGDP